MTRFNVGDRVRQGGRTAVVRQVAADRLGVLYELDPGVWYGDAELQPAPREFKPGDRVRSKLRGGVWVVRVVCSSTGGNVYGVAADDLTPLFWWANPDDLEAA